MRGGSFLLCSLLAVSLSGCLVETPEGPAAPPQPARLADATECLGVYPDGTSVDCKQDVREPFPNDPLPPLWVCNFAWQSPWGTHLRLLHDVVDQGQRYLALSGSMTADPAAGFVGIASSLDEPLAFYELGPGVYGIPAEWDELSLHLVETQVEATGADALVHENLDLRVSEHDGQPWFTWAFPDGDVEYTFSTMMGSKRGDDVLYAPANMNLTGADFDLELRANNSLIGGPFGGFVVGPSFVERVVSGEC